MEVLVFMDKRKKLFVLTISLSLASFVFIIIIITELSLKYVMGLGNPILYDNNPFYGYRPIPNQNSRRFWGAQITINNLGLRAVENWDNNTDDKILFLGDSVTYGGSYIDDNKLFSHIAIKNNKRLKSGNGGVNGWGVENIYGLIVESKFRPAKYYITTLTEGDFHRGLVRIQGSPFYNQSPRFALIELWYFFCFQQSNKKLRNWEDYADNEIKEKFTEKAVKKLIDINSTIKENGGKHFIFITPSKYQVYGKTPKDPIIYETLTKYNVKVNYIKDLLSKDDIQDKNIYYDYCHLDEKGHEIWARIIGDKIKSMF
jgi:hypothetical protein